jgi:hypothetical protein
MYKKTNPITLDHNNFLEWTLILVMRTNVGHINVQPHSYISRKLEWATLNFMF